MELRARAKQRPERLPPSPPKQNGVYDQSIYIRCNALLYNTIQNMIRASHAAMDFTYLSPTDFHSLCPQGLSRRHGTDGTGRGGR